MATEFKICLQPLKQQLIPPRESMLPRMKEIIISAFFPFCPTNFHVFFTNFSSKGMEEEWLWRNMSQEEDWGYTLQYHHYSKRWIWIWIVLGMEAMLNCWDDGLLLRSRGKWRGRWSSPSVLELFHTTFGITQFSLYRVNPALTDLSVTSPSTNFRSLEVSGSMKPSKIWV